MDLSAIVEAVNSVVKFIVESGIVDKIADLIKQAVPYIVELVGSLSETAGV